MTTRQKASRETMRSFEEHGIALRRKAGVGRTGPLDPFERLAELGLRIDFANALESSSEADREQTKSLDARRWSGTGGVLPDGTILVVLNPAQTRERSVVTVMEEVAHVHHGHTPTVLKLAGSEGTPGRHYDEQSEQEAYWTAAAALLPSRAVARAVWEGRSAESLASEYRVSKELAEFRIKTLGLWPHYQNRKEAA